MSAFCAWLLGLSAFWTASTPAAHASDCLPGDILLNSQSDIDDFQDRHGPCNRVGSSLTIEGLDVSSLAGLSNLNQIEGNLQISETQQLVDLKGLESLTGVGGDVAIFHNWALTSVDGLSSLASVGGDFGIYANPEQRHVDALFSLASVGGFMALTDLHSLADLDGLSALRNIGSHLIVKLDHALANVNGLSALERVGGMLIIEFNDVLTNVDGLYALTRVGINAEIFGNASLADLNGLSALASVGRDLAIQSNPSLRACGGIARLLDEVDHAEIGPGGISVPDVGGSVILESNGDSCNSIAAILSRPANFTINPGLNDAWYNPATPGQGFFINVYEDIGQVFLGWFTFDTQRPPGDTTAVIGDPGHRWLTALGSYAGNAAVLDIEITRGGRFDSPLPATDSEHNGAITLEFTACDAGAIGFDLPSIGEQGVIPIERIARDNVPLCEALSARQR